MRIITAITTAALLTCGMASFGNTELINHTGRTIYVGTSHATTVSDYHCHMTQAILEDDNITLDNIDHMLICMSNQLEERDDITVTQPDPNKIPIYLSDKGYSSNWYANSQSLTPANTTNIDSSDIIEITD